ncbi:MAG: hypothetical protein EZS28_049691 [Streblomastix strix]|uniref:HTH CENPB-type domain-containing protein n=1 Tax=Streblomastix strix TaxID=222440 RepID=A0A5J4TA62_9EUKA|nr:MAG: hypothetical protein EZS28_049691 [Streblomastix strix]
MDSTFSIYIIKKQNYKRIWKRRVCSQKIRKRSGLDPNLEIALQLWLREFKQTKPRVVITDPILKQAGDRLFALLNEDDNHGSMHDYGNAVSESYMQRWKMRCNQKQEKLFGESVSEDMDSANTWIENQLPQIIKKFGIEIVYRSDEFGLYYEQGVETTITDRGQQEHEKKIKVKSDSFS